MSEALEDKQKLLKFINIFAIGGTENQFLLTASSIDPARFELHVACLQRRGALLERVESLRCPLVEYPITSLYKWSTLRQQIKLARYLRWNGIGIVHTYNFYPNVFGIPAARLAGVPHIVASIRDTGAYLNPLQAKAQKIACMMADSIVANADAVRSWLVSQGHSPKKIRVIRNGVDFSRFAARLRVPRLHREFGLPDRVPLIAVVARLSRVKGIDDFVRAASGVASQFPEARFVVFGDTSHSGDPWETAYADELRQLAASLGIADRLFFAGYRTDVAELLPEITLSVLPSHTEGLPNAILESMAAGVPVVATNVGGVPELIEDGVCGLLVPPHDPRALSSAICRLLTDPVLANGLAAAAKRSVRERFSVERMVRETEELYASLTRRKSRPSAAASLRAEASERARSERALIAPAAASLRAEASERARSERALIEDASAGGTNAGGGAPPPSEKEGRHEHH
jgi:glycosyltransferase involved in cell wall biosynthesis